MIMEENGNIKEIVPALKRKNAINSEISRAISAVGELFLSYYPIYTENQAKNMKEEDWFVQEYMYIDENGKKQNLKLYGDGFDTYENLEYFAFVKDGSLYACDSNGSVFEVDLNESSLDYLFQADETITEFCLYKNMLLAVSADQVWIYDLQKNELLQNSEILNEFIRSHQMSSKSIVLCSDAEQGIIYIGCHSGIYQYIWDGSVIEQIVDGQYLSFGDASLTPVMLQVTGEKEFRVFFDADYFAEIYFDENLATVPEEVLTIYSLNENERIRYAARLFQKRNSNVYVRYDTALHGDNAVSKEDALKNLNTELLADEGPDILILDGMDILQYMKKGVLKSLDEVIDPYTEEDALYTNIVEAMRITADKKIYALPLTFYIPIWESDRRYLGDAKNLEDIAEGIALAREEHPGFPILWSCNEEQLLDKFIFTSFPAWTKEDGEIDVEALEEFFVLIKDIWDSHIVGISEEEIELLAHEDSQSKGTNRMLTSLGVYSSLGSERIWADFGYIRSVEDYMFTCLDVSNINKYGTKDMDAMFGPYQGQAKNVFWGNSIAAICESTKNETLATEFFELLLSEEMMDQWWLENGFPIRKDSLVNSLDIRNNQYEQYIGVADRDEITWVTEENQQILLHMIEQLEVFYQPGSALEKVVKETGVLICKGEISPQQGAQEVLRRMKIQMEE